MKFKKAYIKETAEWLNKTSNNEYLARHPDLENFNMPKYFYFRIYPDKAQIHWAIIKKNETFVTIYFINNMGRIFDKLEFKNIKIARRRLRKNGFDFSTNRYCPFLPSEPLYINLCTGKKTAPYSKGNLWQSVQRNHKHLQKIEKTIIKQKIELYEHCIGISKLKIKKHRKQSAKETKKFKTGCLILAIIYICIVIYSFLT